MTLKLATLPLKDASVANALREAQESDFDVIYIIGMKGKQLCTLGSRCGNRLEMLGLLEAAKQDFWTAGAEDI